MEGDSNEYSPEYSARFLLQPPTDYMYSKLNLNGTSDNGVRCRQDN